MANPCRLCNQSIELSMTLGTLIFPRALKKPILCEDCYKQFEKIDLSAACKMCSKELKEKGMEEYCSDCLKWKKIYPEMIVNHQSIYKYNDFAKEWMKQLKFTGDILLAGSLSTIVRKTVKPYLKSHFIVPIPSSRNSIEERGFNQVEVLLDFAGVSFEKALINIGEGARQVTKGRSQRLETVQPFILSEEFKNLAKKKNILLVDDVYTTGRTIFHARECFLNAGIQNVSSLTIFR